jgi:hypothetical protein
MAVKEPILLGDHPRYEIRMGASAFKHFCSVVFTIVAVFAHTTQTETKETASSFDQPHLR